MNKTICQLCFLLCCAAAMAQQSDPRSLHMLGMALEGPVDSLRQQLTDSGFSEWGGSEDGEDLYFRGKFYGIRAKLIEIGRAHV